LIQFWLSNKPHDEAQRYGVSWGDPEKWALERERASKKILKELSPELKSNPLGLEVLKVVKKLESEAVRLQEEGKFISVVICTQGVPTDPQGLSNSAVMKDCLKNLKALSNLPVKLVFRLCTKEKKVLNFYKKVDLDIECDVLGNYWDEVSSFCHC
jgi:hypothetical protein